MTRLQRSRALRWLCTLATVAALVVMLFPVYAVIVGSFESTETLFSGNVLLAAARPDTGQLPDRHPGAIRQRADEPHRRRGDGAAGLGRGRARGLRAREVPLAGDRGHSQRAARSQIVPSIVLATSLFIIFHWIHLVNTYPGLIIADGTYAIPFAILVLRAFFFSLPNEVHAGGES